MSRARRPGGRAVGGGCGRSRRWVWRSTSIRCRRRCDERRKPMKAVTVLTALVMAGVVDADVLPGPNVGDKVAVLKVAAVVGPWAGKDVDITAERKEAGTLYVFVTEGHW